MRTKILNKYILIPMLAMGAVACNETEFLDLKNPNTITNEFYWNTEADVEAAMATVYSPIRSQMYGYFGAFTGFQNVNGRGDDFWGTVQDDPDTWDIITFKNNSSNGRYDYDRLYQCIYRANVVLANIGKVNMDEQKRKEYIAEAKFLRGYHYFLLVTNWGRVPLHLQPIESTMDTHKEAATEAELWKQVEEDLLAAKADLPLVRPAGQQGRALKGAAIAFLGKAYIYEGKFKEGKEELELIMKAPYTYDLAPDYESNFIPEGEFNEESIFELNYDKFGTNGAWGAEEANSTQGNVLPNFIGVNGGWFKMQPTAFLVEEFMKEERPDGSDSRFDKRMYTNFYFVHSEFNDPKPEDVINHGRTNFEAMWEASSAKRALGQPDYPKAADGSEGRFMTKKYTNWWSDRDDANSMYVDYKEDNNYRVMRFAEVLLLHAEAAAKTNDLAAANADLKRIRERAGLVEKTFGSVDEIMAEVEHQRILEFFMEGQRFYDLKRWYPWQKIKEIFVRNKKQGADNFEEKHLYYPIPHLELITNTSIQQNPLWN